VPEEMQSVVYKSTNKDYLHLAKTNADTFAHATSLLFYSTQKGSDKTAEYKNFLQQKARNFRRPSVSE